MHCHPIWKCCHQEQLSATLFTVWHASRSSMKLFDETVFPLASIRQQDLASVCNSLWNWSPCHRWIDGEPCQATGCHCHRARALKSFFEFYKEATTCYLPDVVGHTSPALRSHQDLAAIVEILVTKDEICRSQLTTEYFDQRAQQGCERPPINDQNRAFNLAARVICMVHPSAESQTDGLLDSGVQPVIWCNDKSFSSFVASVFPRRQHPALNTAGGDSTHSANIKLSQITAKRLRKVARLDIIPTNDLRDHLHLDETNGTVSVFHYTSFLKEYLHAYSNARFNDSRYGLIVSPVMHYEFGEHSC
jgi:hypothetical protein